VQNIRGEYIMLIIIGLNKIPIATQCGLYYDFCTRSVYTSEICPLLA
jgi:hypothetical protein